MAPFEGVQQVVTEAGAGDAAGEPAVAVDEVHRQQEVAVGEEGLGATFGSDPVVLAEDHAAVGQHLE